MTESETISELNGLIDLAEKLAKLHIPVTKNGPIEGEARNILTVLWGERDLINETGVTEDTNWIIAESRIRLLDLMAGPQGERDRKEALRSLECYDDDL